MPATISIMLFHFCVNEKEINMPVTISIKYKGIASRTNLNQKGLKDFYWIHIRDPILLFFANTVCWW